MQEVGTAQVAAVSSSSKPASQESHWLRSAQQVEQSCAVHASQAPVKGSNRKPGGHASHVSRLEVQDRHPAVLHVVQVPSSEQKW